MANLSSRNNGIILISDPQSVDKAGFIMETAENSVPDGWLECDGSPVSRTAYAELFAAIGTTFGAGDGVNTFNLPDANVDLESLSIQNDLTVNGAIVNPGLKHIEYVRDTNQGPYAAGGASPIVVYNTEVVKNGFTTEYNTGTGVFTASETGCYLVTAGVSLTQNTSARIINCVLSLTVNGVGESDIISDFRVGTNQDVTIIQGSGSKVLYLTAGEYFSANVYGLATGDWKILGTSPAHRTYLTVTKIG